MGKGSPNQMNSAHKVSVCIRGKEGCVGTQQRQEYELKMDGEIMTKKRWGHTGPYL